MTFAALGRLTSLRELRIPGNKLTALPQDLGFLVNLRKLIADNNLISSIPSRDNANPVLKR